MSKVERQLKTDDYSIDNEFIYLNKKNKDNEMVDTGKKYTFDRPPIFRNNKMVNADKVYNVRYKYHSAGGINLYYFDIDANTRIFFEYFM